MNRGTRNKIVRFIVTKRKVIDKNWVSFKNYQLRGSPNFFI